MSTTRHAASTAIIRAALAAYTVLVLLITLWPSPSSVAADTTIGAVLEWAWRSGLPREVTFEIIEFSANIAMFLPLGVLLALALPARLWWLSLLAGPVLSLAIETTQGVFLPERYPTMSDVIANSAGALIGVGAVWAIRALRRRRLADAAGAPRS